MKLLRSKWPSQTDVDAVRGGDGFDLAEALNRFDLGDGQGAGRRLSPWSRAEVLRGSRRARCRSPHRGGRPADSARRRRSRLPSVAEPTAWAP